MRPFQILPFVAVLLVTGCASTVVESPDPSGAGGASSGGGDSSSGSGPSSQGVPCKYLHGQVTLSSYTSPDKYASSAYSFEFASQDVDLTKNDWDLVYEGNAFIVNTVVDDVSFIVDLGKVPLAGVPSIVKPSDFPTGSQGEHDRIQAVISHTYVVRTIDGDTKEYAAFQVLALSPGQSATIEWIRSASTDTLEVPVGCGF